MGKSDKELMGDKGESLARLFLKDQGFYIQQPDWIINQGDKYYIVEVKYKEMFNAPPFDGHGLNIAQIQRRLTLQKHTGLRCYLLVMEPNSDRVFVQFLDVLNDGEHFDTKQGVRIFPLKCFRKFKMKELT